MKYLLNFFCVLALCFFGGTNAFAQSAYNWEQTSLTATNFQASFGRLVAHPVDPNILFLCTISPLDPISGTPGLADGIWKTADLGNTWTVLSDSILLADYSILDLAISPAAPDTLMVATKEHGIFKSIDGGLTWVEINNGLPFPHANLSAVALASDPTDADKVYLSVAQTDGLDISNLSPSHPGFFWSHDGGNSWNSNNSGLPDRSDSLSDGNSRTAVPASISVLPQAPNYVLLGMAEVHVNTVLLFGSKVAKTSGKVFYSTTSGTGNFTEASAGLPADINQGISFGTSVARISSSIMILSNSTGGPIEIWGSHTGLTADVNLAGDLRAFNRGKGLSFTKNGNWQTRNAGLPYISSWTDPASTSSVTLKSIDCTPVGAVAVGVGNMQNAVMVGSLRSDQGSSSTNHTKIHASLNSATSGWAASWDAGLDNSPTLGYTEANAAGITFNSDMSYAFATIRWTDAAQSAPLPDDNGVYRLKLR